MARNEKVKMLAGELYDPSAPELQADLAAAQKWLAHYNAALELDSSSRHELLAERSAGAGSVVTRDVAAGATVFGKPARVQG